jgi:effector-binding domain-containing protein/ribosome-associated toxin RatA of RatAB toxin-antitoxin module
MKALKIIGITVGVIIAILLILPIFLPNTFMVERKIVINASPEAIYAQVNSFKNWERWSPWIEADSTIANTYSGPEVGVGAKSEWKSKKSGNGQQTIIESLPYSSIRTEIKIDDFTPMYSHFTFTPGEGGTTVVWSDSGSMSYPFNIMGLFTDKMMAPDFERGLANLKKLVESNPTAAEGSSKGYRLGEYTVETTKPQPIIYITDSCSMDKIGEKMGEMYGSLQAFLGKNKGESIGMPMAIWHNFDVKNMVFEAAFPVAKEMPAGDGVQSRTMPATKVLIVSHFGPYAAMEKSTEEVMAYIQKQGYEINGYEFDVYMNDPADVKPEEIETRMHFPIK